MRVDTITIPARLIACNSLGGTMKDVEMSTEGSVLTIKVGLNVYKKTE